MTQARSGHDSADLTLDALRAGGLVADDVRIHPDTLEHQAQVAEAHANPQLAANLRRAAELTALADDEVLGIYEALRPHRSSYDELRELAASLEARGAQRNAALLRGSSTALRSNIAVASVLRDALAKHGLPEDAVILVEDTAYETATAVMQLTGYVDCLIPRGGPSLINSIRDNATVPVIIDGDGNCHV